MFSDFVDKVLSNHRSNIYQFRQKCAQHHSFFFVNLCINGTLLRNAKVLDLCVSMSHGKVVPESFYSFNTGSVKVVF